MYVYLLAASAGSEYHADGTAADPEIDEIKAALDAVMPGLRAAIVLPDYIVGAKGFPDNLISQELAARFKCRMFFALFDELAPEKPMPPVDKILNKFIGKEKLVAVVSREMWLAIARHMAGDDALAPGFTPGMLTLAELYIKRFPAPGAAKLNFVRSAAELSAR